MEKISDKELADKLKLHRLWIGTGGDEGEQLVLKGYDLNNTNLACRELTRGILYGCSLMCCSVPDSNLEGASLVGSNFRWANLEGVNLKSANIKGTDFERANLRQANLEEATLEGANLRWADSKYAELENANLCYAKLMGADLRWADLRWANLRQANLEGANLKCAYLEGANLEDTAIRYVIGDGHYIKNIDGYKYYIAYTDTDLAIGCEQHPIEDWLEFSDEKIAAMDVGALKWWRRNKDAIIGLIGKDLAE